MVIPAQYGERHVGLCKREARSKYMKGEEMLHIPNPGTEFGLGAFHIACMALTHPERYTCREEIDTDCPGDIVVTPDRKLLVPHFSYNQDFRGDKLEFWGREDYPYYKFGGVTAFVPK